MSTIVSPEVVKIPEDEPIFVLRAQDRLASTVVRIWALLAQTHEVDNLKVVNARIAAAEMDEWASKKGMRRLKLPD